jgi:uncharacterized protein with PIN domain
MSRPRVAAPKNPETVGFLCDVMLGRLARELRLLGIDCEYDRSLGGMQAYRAARGSGRVFLTRTNRLRGLPGTIHVQSQIAPEQVAQIKAELDAGLKPAAPVTEETPPLSQQPPAKLALGRPRHLEAKPAQETPALGRCLACNAPLEKISREQARPSVPFFVYQIHHEFRRCPKCHKVFWPGNHVADMERRVQAGPSHRQHRT